ncbi:MAG: serine--tRNA ligase [Patescibacteria group bacterium]
MLDIKFIRENPKLVEEKAKQKGYVIRVEKLLKVDGQRRSLIEEIDHLRSDRKKAANARDEKRGQQLKKGLKEKEDKLEKLQEEFYVLIREVPNIPKDDVPEGIDETDNKVLREVGDKPKLDFKPKDHLELGIGLDLIDTERAAKISGSRFGYLKNEAVILEFALVQLALETLSREGFIPIVPPALIKKEITDHLGYWHGGGNEEYYWTHEPRENQGLYLIGTAEHSIAPMHMDETFNRKDLPQRYVGFSPAFRREAGSYGKDTRGIFRVHQFDKVEMVSFVLPQNEDKEHQYLLSLEEKMVKELGLPYRVVNICTAELGFPTARKYDIEMWLPSQNKYRETHSASTTSDFQARRLNIKYHNGNEKNYVCILNATAFAIGRTIIAIMENYQQKDGSIVVPKALQKYTGFTKIPQ